MKESLGIIAAEGILPIMVADNNASMGNTSVIVCLSGLASAEDFARHIAVELAIGKVSAILKHFKDNDVKKIVICGAMARPNLASISVDTKGAVLLTKILAAKILGDDQLLRIVAEYIEKQGFEIISPLAYTNQTPISTRQRPSNSEKSDIEIGLNAAKILGKLDIGQAVIVEGGVVLGVEGAEGTDMLINRCSRLRKSNKTSGVLVKSLKPTQDSRLDTPVIGVETIRMVKEAGMSGVAVSDVIILNPEEVLQEADKLGVFVVITKS